VVWCDGKIDLEEIEARMWEHWSEAISEIQKATSISVDDGDDDDVDSHRPAPGRNFFCARTQFFDSVYFTM
jgi:hypothetical protein